MKLLAVLSILCCILNLVLTDASPNSSEFMCDNGDIIDLRYKCDFHVDCEDKSDENPSVCGKASCYFRCPSDGKCIRQDQICDENDDCFNGEDEAAEECQFCGDGFMCKVNGYLDCLPQQYVCDNYLDCDDHSDEEQSCNGDYTTLDSSAPAAMTTPTTTTSATAPTTTTATTSPTTTTATSVTTITVSPSTTISTTVTTAAKFARRKPKRKPKKNKTKSSKKCKKNPNHKACTKEILNSLAEQLSGKFIQRCVKKPSMSKCQKWHKVLKIRRDQTPLEFVPKKCKSKPSLKKCKEFIGILATSLPREIVDKCRESPRLKICKKMKVLLVARQS